MKHGGLICFITGLLGGLIISPLGTGILELVEREPYISLAIALGGLVIAIYIVYTMMEKRKYKRKNPFAMYKRPPPPSRQYWPRDGGRHGFSPARFFQERHDPRHGRDPTRRFNESPY